MATFPDYPATTLPQSEELIIFSGNQMHDIINGDALSEVTAEDGNIPTVRKAIADNYYFKSPIAWAASSTETVFNQLRSFTDGSWWWAPQATSTNPINMGASPYNDINWKAWSKDQLATYQNAKRLAAEAGFNMVAGSFYFSGTLNNSSDVLFYEGDGKYYRWAGTFPKVVSAGSTNSDVNWADESSKTLRTQLSRIATFTSATNKYRLTDFVSVYDFGYIGDGTYHAIQEWIDSGRFANITAVQLVYPKATSASQSIDWVAIQTACDYAKGRNVFIPKSVGVITDTVIVPKGTTVYGEGKYDMWADDVSVGTVITTTGSGNPQRWTDITGTDPADDTPMFVAGANGVYFRNLALKSDNWSVGLFFPSVRQCGFSQIEALGFTDACVYLDATWATNNTTMNALHPTVTTEGTMNEFSGIDFYLRTYAPGSFALKVQGTTRAGDSVTAENWSWGTGGTSDVRFMHGRLNGGGSYGGCFKHDVQLYGVTSYGQGVTLQDVALRVNGSGRYMAYLDRSNRIIFDGCYGEFAGGGTNPYFAITSRTKLNHDGIIRLNDKLQGRILVDEIDVGSNSTIDWIDTRCVSVMRVDGRMTTPNIKALDAAQPLELTTYSVDGIQFNYDNGSTRSPQYALSSSNFRPLGTSNLGSSNHPWEIGYINTLKSFSYLTVDSEYLKHPSSEFDIRGYDTFGVRLRTGNATTFYAHTTGCVSSGDGLIIRSNTDNTSSIGHPSYRCSVIYAGTGTINTSDADEKDEFREVSEKEKNVARKLKIQAFKFKDAIKSKGSENARWHFGVVAQEVISAFESEGLNAFDYGLVCYDEWEATEEEKDKDGIVIQEAKPAGKRYGVRYDELSMFILSTLI